MSYPDIPFLDWEFKYEKARPEGGIVCSRHNHDDFVESTKCLYDFFASYVRNRYSYPKITPYEKIQETIKEVLTVQGDSEARGNAWKGSGLIPCTASYDAKVWEEQKMHFADFGTSEKGSETNCYRFHQAATYHRYYMLKDLLPSQGIAVF